MNDFRKANFFNDPDKMRDFIMLTKDAFLSSYSYLTEDEYENTRVVYLKQHIDRKVNRIIEEYNLPVGYISTVIDEEDRNFAIYLDNSIWSNCMDGAEAYEELMTLERGIAIGREVHR